MGRLGSASMTVTLAPALARVWARMSADVDLPAPPLGLANTITGITTPQFLLMPHGAANSYQQQQLSMWCHMLQHGAPYIRHGPHEFLATGIRVTVGREQDFSIGYDEYRPDSEDTNPRRHRKCPPKSPTSIRTFAFSEQDFSILENKTDQQVTIYPQGLLHFPLHPL